MFDKDTLIITYDHQRGEPRGSRPRKADPATLGLGSCIDCTLCVQVCPTGIDIRQGLQYECIGCAACVDVCDDVMDRMGYARGLVRYATQRAIDRGLQGKSMLRRVLRPRVIVYGLILLTLLSALMGSLATRNPLRVDLIRDRNTLARVVDGGDIENTYRIHFMNAAERPLQLDVKVQGLDGLRIEGDSVFDVPAASNRAVAISLRSAPDAASPGAHKVQLIITDRTEPGMSRTETTTFLLPR
jgi:cytochrome c oxidase accessory protein FixG